MPWPIRKSGNTISRPITMSVSYKTIYVTTNQQAGFLQNNISRPISRVGSYKTIYHDQSAGRVLTDQLCHDISFSEQLIGVGQEIWLHR